MLFSNTIFSYPISFTYYLHQPTSLPTPSFNFLLFLSLVILSSTFPFIHAIFTHFFTISFIFCLHHFISILPFLDPSFPDNPFPPFPLHSFHIHSLLHHFTFFTRHFFHLLSTSLPNPSLTSCLAFHSFLPSPSVHSIFIHYFTSFPRRFFTAYLHYPPSPPPSGKYKGLDLFLPLPLLLTRQLRLGSVRQDGFRWSARRS